MNGHCKTEQGFTLVELSIVLVIIGLLIGGVLVGEDLIQSAQTRAQVAQISRYNAAVKVFYDKFQAIPGDMALVTAEQNQFTVGTGCAGQTAARDGDGMIDGWSTEPLCQAEGETALFWQDLSSNEAGNLIEGIFPNSGAATASCTGTATALSGTTLSEYFPAAKIGKGNYVYVYETSGYNWYGLSAITSTDIGGLMKSNASIPVAQAYGIDKKMDDGLPITGNVQATYINNNFTTVQNAPNAASDTTTTCYNTTSASGVYSISSMAHYGNGSNCALSFRFP